jgi:hypothetical protein
MRGALYSAAYTIKMTRKFAGQDSRETWRWKLIIRVPQFIAARDLRDAAAKLKEKGKGDPAAKVRLETIREGRCVQALHVGPYSSEPATIERMKAVAEASGLSFSGAHHEIYLSDPRRVAPEKLRTILRLPVA